MCGHGRAAALCVAASILSLWDVGRAGGTPLERLEPERIGWEAVALRVAPGGLALRFEGSEGASGSCSLRLLGPQGEAAPTVHVRVSQGPHEVLLSRPRLKPLLGEAKADGPLEVDDGDLRLEVTWRPRSGEARRAVGRVAPWLHVPRLERLVATRRQAHRANPREGSEARSRALWEAALSARAAPLRRHLKAFIQKVWRDPRRAEVERLAAVAGLRDGVTPDWFGTPFRVELEVVSDDREDRVLEVRLHSAGPDGRWDTADDFSHEVGLYAILEPMWDWHLEHNPGSRGVDSRSSGRVLVTGTGSGGSSHAVTCSGRTNPSPPCPSPSSSLPLPE